MKGIKIIGVVAVLTGGLGALWWAVFSLKSYDITPEEFQARYAYPRSTVSVELTSIGGNAADLEFRSFDGERVIGRIVYPGAPGPEAKRFPVLIGLHGLGRTHLRWWQADFKGRPTIEGTHLITKLALERGYAVIALDARRHGQRDPGFAASSLLTGLKLWGKREPYERMVIDTVKDYRCCWTGSSSSPRSTQAASTWPATAWVH
jgi:pimeloyl-ACP methyl ester carboxylesterase